MGGCVGTARGGGSGNNGGSSRRASGAFSDSSSSIHTTKNRPLRHEKIRWKSDIPLTDGQLKSKRDEFWDTAPAFEGKPEIWNALKAAVEAADTNEDFELAQAILDGAGISMPNGSLVECYDELGTRYAIPVYCLSYPINIVREESSSSSRPESPLEHFDPSKSAELRLRVRISLTGNDVKLIVNSESTVAACKRKLQEQEKLNEPPSRQRWYFGGKLLPDKSKIGKFGIPSGYVVQCVLNNLDFDIIQTKD